MNEDDVKRFAENVRDMMGNYAKQKELHKELFRLCIKHLEDRGRLIPNDRWKERMELIGVLKEITRET